MSDQDSESEDTPKSPSSMKDAFKAERGTGQGAMFTPEEMDIYCNKVTLETYIFHGKDVDYDSIHYLEYDPKEKRVDVVKRDGTRIDLGVKIQWLVRPYFSKAKEISIVQTKDREPIDGTIVPLVHKGDSAPPA